MNILPTNFTVVDYCQAMQRGEIVVNRDYQRSDRVWPPAARSFLIETVVLGYPMPKLSLYQVTDVRSKKTFKEIVDGQQRSMAIRDFFEDKLNLAASLDTDDLAGRKYSELSAEHQQRFLDYHLSVDLFVGASLDEVREVFRRINSYTIPLNPEEQRHATYQGKFKWFTHRVAHRIDDALVQMGVFNEKQLIRMQDAKLVAEVCHALLFGIQTTNRRKLDTLYRERDAEFPEQAELEGRIIAGIDQLLEWTEIHNATIMKPYLVYSLLLAITHRLRPLAVLAGDFPADAVERFDTAVATTNLAALSQALEEEEPAEKFEEFSDASSSRTNVAEQRRKRFQWLCKALGPSLL